MRTFLMGICVFAWGASQPLFAQGRIGAPKWDVEISKFGVERVRNDENGPRVAGLTIDKQSQWWRLDLEYELSGGTAGFGEEVAWADQVELEWVVIFPREYRNRLNPRYCLRMKRQVVYANVAADEKSNACIYIPPQALSRYEKSLASDRVFAEVSVRVNGRTIGQAWLRRTKFVTSAAEVPRLFPEFGRDSWFSVEGMAELQHLLLTRRETPWRWSSWGSYEQIIKD